jgi:hypothetical protein
MPEKLTDDGLLAVLRSEGLSAFDGKGNLACEGPTSGSHAGGSRIWGLRERLIADERYEDVPFVSGVISAYSATFERFDERLAEGDGAEAELIRLYDECVLCVWLDGGNSAFDGDGLFDGAYGLDVLKKGEAMHAARGMYRSCAKWKLWQTEYVSLHGTEPKGSRVFDTEAGNRAEDLEVLKDHHQRRLQQNIISI